MKGTWIIREVSWLDAAQGAVRAFAGDREFAWLDSAVTADLRTSPARYSLICREPLAVLEQHEDRAAQLCVGGSVVAAADSGWRLWRQTIERMPRFRPVALGLSPGWVGYVGFEMARQLERLAGSLRLGESLPLMRMALYDRGIVLDHYEGRAHLLVAAGVRPAIGLHEPPLESLTEDWEQAVATRTQRCRPVMPRLRFEMEREAYERMVARALEYIAAGDIYQVNLAQRLRFEGVEDPLSTYFELRCKNPAPYAAFLRWAGGAIGSLSPELFLRKRGRAVLTRPIKGTRPRTGDPQLDGAYRRELLDSAKDAAELAMIIDLHRNDLGRVCEFGSVRVRAARRLETHPTVFHTVADVAGRLRSEQGALDLLAACFPAGSISGVPKIRALEVIDELEPVARGAYTGAVGVLGLDGQMVFNVAIRTLQFCAQAATLHVGGGIVAESDPADEYEETLAKARGIVRALERAKGDSPIEEAGPTRFEAPSCVSGSV